MYGRPATRNKNRTRVAQAARVPASLALLLLIVATTAVLAEEPTNAAPVADDAVNDASSTTTPPLIALGDGLQQSELDGSRAKAMLEIDKVFVNDQELNGTVSDNVAINTNSGANMISGDSFSGASGLINTIQNTGNNVLIQSATIVNVSIEN
ncbi:MAG: hypothetical protein HKN56_02470 [Gammaproteobacteria bacterium]|nr:hypothetical protein [Gammaproteobacteria bacterium]